MVVTAWPGLSGAFAAVPCAATAAPLSRAVERRAGKKEVNSLTFNEKLRASPGMRSPLGYTSSWDKDGREAIRALAGTGLEPSPYRLTTGSSKRESCPGPE